MSRPPRAHEMGVIGCHTCGMVSQDRPAEALSMHCSRCGSPMHCRRPDSIARAWALLLASVIFYFPANFFPVMYTSLLGRGSENTILQGVVEFWKSGSYGIALVIFIASVAVPCTKFFALGFLLVTTQRRSSRNMRARAQLYRLVELVGYWSMLDVLVVAIVTSLVKFHVLSDSEPRIGILFFGMVVILTMLSAMSFDPRLIWDGQKDD